MAEKRYVLANEKLTVTVSNIGAQIKSIKNQDDREYMWSGDPAIWNRTAPIMFPICGGLRDDAYIYGDKKYTLTKHGFVLFREFDCEEHSQDVLTLVTRDTPDTREVYPFNFEFRVRFTLEDNTLHVSFLTTNTGAGTMYYAPGAHEAYSCPEGIEEYDVVFDKTEPLVRTVLDGNYLEHKTEPVEADGNTLHMKYSHMDNDCVVFENLKSRGATLTKRDGSRKIHVAFDDFKYFVLWTKKGAPYLCLEPWNGIPDRVDADGILVNKEGILALESGGTQIFTHHISILA